MADKVLIAIKEENVALVLEGLECLKEEVVSTCNIMGGCTDCQEKWHEIQALIKGILAASPEIQYSKE
jgi:hypothetical protein